MATHGTIAIRRKETREETTLDEVFVFHILWDGYRVEEFMKKHEKPSTIDGLIFDAIRFCTQHYG